MILGFRNLWTHFDKMTKEASRIANRYIDAKVGADARLVFYSLRHKFKDMARKAGIIDSTIDRICGHAPVTPGGRYGDGVDAATLYREVMKIDFSMIDVSSLRAAWASIDWDEIAAKLVAAGRRNDRLILK
jgi:integrase